MADNPFAVDFTPTESPVKQTAANINNLQAGYTQAIQNQTSVPNLITQFDEQYGVPQLQGQIQAGTEQYDYLGNQIRNMNKQVGQASQESLLTQGQRDRVVQAGQAPILEQQGMLGQNLARLGENLSRQQSNAARMVEATQIQQQKELQPWLQAFKNEEIIGAMAMTGWSQTNAMELDRLLHNSNQGMTLSENEKNRMHELSMMEKQFENTLKLQQNEQSFVTSNRSPYENLMAVGEGTTIFDPATGQSIFKANKTYKPESYAPTTSVGSYLGGGSSGIGQYLGSSPTSSFSSGSIRLHPY